MSSNDPGGGGGGATVNPYAKTTKKKIVPTTAAAAAAAAAASASAVIHNPYAKKRSLTTPSAPTFYTNLTSTANNNNNNNGGGGGDDDGLQLHPYSFSQAFDTNTTHSNNDATSAQETAERRAINFQASTTTTDNNSNNNNNNGDVRQQHLHLQPHILKVSNRQKGNPVLQFIRNVPFGFVEMVPDYIMNATTCALYLSLKYHRLFPAYVHRRLAELRDDFRLRILLVLVDVSDDADLLLQLNRLGATARRGLTVVLAWSESEAGRYLETYKALDGKDATSIQRKESNHVVDQMQDFWTACKPVNRTDAANLWEHFGNLKAVVRANRDEWALVPGLGPVKTQRLYEALHKPFSSRGTRNRKRIKEQQQQEQQEEEKEKKQKMLEEEEDDNDEEEVE